MERTIRGEEVWNYSFFKEPGLVGEASHFVEGNPANHARRVTGPRKAEVKRQK